MELFCIIDEFYKDLSGITQRHPENRSSRNLVGIPIQHSDSEKEELFVHDSMQIRPEKFDFGIE